MSATIIGMVVLENARSLDGSPSTVIFDGKMWLGAGHVLRGGFRYDNNSNEVLPDIGHYIAYIHVRTTSFPFPLFFFLHRTGRQIRSSQSGTADKGKP